MARDGGPDTDGGGPAEGAEAFGLSRIRQIAQPVHDLERATGFYRDLLGLELLFTVPGQFSFFDCDGTWLMVALPEGEGQDHPGSVLYFEVEDLGGAYEILRTRGVEFLEEPHRIADMGSYELWMAFFRDPDGNTLALRSEVAK
jgi:methylmalonyl-CoA/ethylmalonyl-CoA epimerase